MDRTLKALSLILSYPNAELQAAMEEIGTILAGDERIPVPQRQRLLPLIATLEHGDITELEETYVGLFDRSRSLSLNLFEHVHRESRERGGAMVSLIETYRGGGFEPTGWELPDHLPVLLEFLATRPGAEAREVLADAAHILEALATRLDRRESSYAPVFTLLVTLAEAQADTNAVEALLAEPETDPDDLEALDAVWEESEVTFGPDPSAGCPVARDTLAKMTPVQPAAE